jgi:hypothetical protein
MFAQLCGCSATTELNQFIRPNGKIDTVSATQRLALRGGRFMAYDEVAIVIAGGLYAELADALMIILGSHFELLSDEDVQAIGDIYTTVPSTGMVANAADGMMKLHPNPAEQETFPCVLIQPGGNEAARSPVTSVAAACLKKETLSSPEDDSSLDETPCGEVPHPLSVSPWQRLGQHLIKRRKHCGQDLRNLTQMMKLMSFGNNVG